MPLLGRPTIEEIETKEREIASRQPGGYRRADRVWLRSEALKQLRATCAKEQS